MYWFLWLHPMIGRHGCQARKCSQSVWVSRVVSRWKLYQQGPYDMIHFTSCTVLYVLYYAVGTSTVSYFTNRGPLKIQRHLRKVIFLRNTLKLGTLKYDHDNEPANGCTGKAYETPRSCPNFVAYFKIHVEEKQYSHNSNLKLGKRKYMYIYFLVLYL